jgi:hypothetical protein
MTPNPEYVSDEINPNPRAWPVCSHCEVAFVLRRLLSFSSGSFIWAWQRDCKHKNAEAKIGKADD